MIFRVWTMTSTAAEKADDLKAYGYDMAVLAGDALMIYAFEVDFKGIHDGSGPCEGRTCDRDPCGEDRDLRYDRWTDRRCGADRKGGPEGET